MPYYTKQVDDITLTIDPDPDSDWSPRDDDNFGIMICMHRRYELGDKFHYDLPEGVAYHFDDDGNWLEDPDQQDENGVYVNVPCCVRGQGEFDDKYDMAATYSQWFLKTVQKEGGIVLPLYLYDHGGITISTSAFQCTWDSGQVGYIYVTKAKIIENYGDDSDESKARATDLMVGEVKEYAMFIEGDIWKYEITTGVDDADEDLTGHGILGYDNCLEQAEAELTHIVFERARGMAAREDR